MKLLLNFGFACIIANQLLVVCTICQRGMGKAAVGSSLSLISPGEDKTHGKVCEALNSKHLFQEVNMDGRLLAAAQERANLAAKVVECDEVETKAQKSNKWFEDAAEEAGLDLDEDMIDEGLAGGDQRDQTQAARGQGCTCSTASIVGPAHANTALWKVLVQQ